MATASLSQKHGSVRIDGLVFTFVIINVNRQSLMHEFQLLEYGVKVKTVQFSAVVKLGFPFNDCKQAENGSAACKPSSDADKQKAAQFLRQAEKNKTE